MSIGLDAVFEVLVKFFGIVVVGGSSRGERFWIIVVLVLC